MKKITILVIIAFMFLNSVVTGFAETINFSKNLSIGSRGSDVIALQNFLENHSFLSFPQSLNKGYFGQLTKKALSLYQSNVGISPTGYFGPITRNRINADLATNTQDSSIKLISPNGGEVWTIGSSQIIKWQASSDITHVSIIINKYKSECYLNGTFICQGQTGVPIAPPTISVVPNTGEYLWVVGSPLLYPFNEAYNSVTNGFSQGQYQITLIGSSLNNTKADQSDNPFIITP